MSLAPILIGLIANLFASKYADKKYLHPTDAAA
jgi:hypothetical protein